MPTTKEPLAIYEWVVRYKNQSVESFDYVKAAYFQDEGEFFSFKDGHHKSIYLVAKSELLDIGRG